MIHIPKSTIVRCLILISAIDTCNAFTTHSNASLSTFSSYKQDLRRYSSRTLVVHNTSPIKEWMSTKSLQSGRRIHIAKPLKYVFYTNNNNKVSAIYENTNVQRRILAISMSMITGLADVSIYTKFQGFCTMMTGNLIWLGRSLADRQLRDTLYYSSLMISYVLGLIAFRVINTATTTTTDGKKGSLSEKKQKKLRILPKCATMVALLMATANICLNATGMKWLSISIMSFTFGIINSVGTHSTGSLTFVITGHLTKLTTEIMDYFNATGKKDTDYINKRKSSSDNIIQNASLIIAFLTGAIIASLNIISVKYDILFIGLLYSISFLWKDRMEIMQLQQQRDDEVTMSVSCDDTTVPFDSTIGNTCSNQQQL